MEIWIYLILACWIIVDCTRTLAKEFCHRDSLELDQDAQAVFTAILAIRDTKIDVIDNRSARSKNSHQAYSKWRYEGNTTGPSSAPTRKSCGPVSQNGLQTLVAIDWVVNILNSKSGDVFGTAVNDSFIPGIKLGFQAYDTCGLENLPVSQLIGASADFYRTPSKNCLQNSTTINAGALIDEMNEDDLVDAVNFMKQYSKPLLTLSSLPESLTDISKYGNVFSTLPSIVTKTEAMIQIALQFGWTHVHVLFEDSAYGKEGKRQLLKSAKQHDLCILSSFQIPTISNLSSELYSVRTRLENIITQIVANLPHAPVVLIFASELSSVAVLQVSSNSSHVGKAAQLRWLLSDFIKQSHQFGNMFSARGLFALAPDSPPDVPEFRDYWRSIDARSTNGWVREYYQEKLGCRFADHRSQNSPSTPICSESASFLLGDIEADIVVSPDTIAVIDAVYSFAVAIRKAWSVKCRGRSGLCPKLLQMSPENYLEIVQNTEFEYDATLRSPPSLLGRRVNFRISAPESLAVYELVEHEEQLLFMEVFTFQGGELHLSGQPLFYSPNGSISTIAPASSCSSETDCTCSNSIPQSPKRHSIYKPGDILLAGIFPIHSSTHTDGISCGKIRDRDGYQLAESFWYAVDKVNDKSSPSFSSLLRGVKLGSLALDSCGSVPRASYLASSLIINADSFDLPTTDDQAAMKGLKSQNIMAVIGELGDETSTEVASILRFAGLTQLSYGSRSADLGDTYTYPTVLRTVVSDNTRLNMTFNTLRQMDWDYVQVVFSDTGYGRSMIKWFQEAAIEAGVCVAQTLPLLSNSSNAAELVEALLRKPNAAVVILFLEKKPLRSLLESLQRIYESSRTTTRFVLIAADHWYNDPKLVRGVELAADGALAFAARRLANQQFQQHISSKSLGDAESNPWWIEYTELMMRCNFPGLASPREYSAACNPAATLGHMPGFRADLSTNDVINSVYAVAFGLDAMLRDYCGEDYHGLCSRFETLSNRNVLLYEYIRRVQFEDETGRVFTFSDHRDAATPVAVLHVKSEGRNVQYVQAGLYSSLNTSEHLSFIQPHVRRSLHDRTTSNCNSDKFNCMECRRFPVERSETDFTTPTSPSTPATSSTASPTTTPNPTRNRNDRNLSTRPPSNTFYPKKFLYLPSSDKFVLGAAFPLHSRTGASSPFQCGQLLEEGVLMVEAFLWALDTINANSDSFKFNLGGLILDSCSNAGQVVNDLRDLYTKPNGYFTMNGTENVNSDEIIGFINDPMDESTTSLSAGLLSSLNVTNFGVGSITSAYSTDEPNFPYSLHTLSPVDVQYSAILSFMERMNWTYGSIIYSGRRWGVDAYLKLKSDALDRRFCFGTEFAIQDSENSSQYDKAVTALKSKIWQSSDGNMDGARAVILLLDKKAASLFLRSVARAVASGLLTPSDRFVFIGAASWGDRVPFREGEEQAALGSVIFQHDSQPVDAFLEYLESLRYDNDRNPWWKEFWHRKFSCELQEACRRHTLGEAGLQNEALYTNIMNAAWAAVVGLNNLCTPKKGQQSPCAHQKNKNFRRQLLESIRGSGFSRVDNPQESFQFNDEGWSESGFYILNLLQDDTGGLEYKAIGRYVDKNGLALSDAAYGYDKTSTRVELEKLKSRCTDPKLCPQCGRFSKATDGIDPTGSSSTADFLTMASTSQSATALIPAYGVHLSNSTYTDAFLYAPGSADSYLIAVTFPVHARGPRPLSCGRLRPEHYQNLQAFLWALKNGPADSPFPNLGALIFDTCSDAMKAVRDLSNFLSEQVIFRTANGEKIDPNRTLAVLNSPYTAEALPIANLLASYGIPNISPGLSASMLTLTDTYKAEMTLRTSVPTDVQARAMVSLLKEIGWNAVSVLFTDNVWGLNGQTDFRTEAEHSNVCIVISETIPESDDPTCSEFISKIDETITRLLVARRSANIRGVVAWLTEESLRCLLLGLKRAIERGTMKSGDLNLILPADVADLRSSLIDDFQREVIGFVAFQYAAANVEPFKEYWQKLVSSDDVSGGHFWSKEYERNGQSTGTYRQNGYLLNTINAVFSIAIGLEHLRANVCSNAVQSSVDTSEALCPQLVDSPQFRSLLLDSIRKVEFDDVTGKRFRFIHDSFGSEALTVSNLVSIQEGVEFREIGSYESDQLKLLTPPQGFDGQSAFSLRDHPPSCHGKDAHICGVCSTRKTHATSIPQAFDGMDNSLSAKSASSVGSSPISGTTAAQRNENSPSATLPIGSSLPTSSQATKDIVILPASRRFSIVGLFPVHKRGRSSLHCEGFSALTGFQSLAAFLYAVDEINRDQYILPGMRLGAVAIDYCGSEERALADLFSILSPPNGVISSEDIVAAIDFDNVNGGDEVERFFHDLRIPTINSAPTPLSSRDRPLTFGTVPADDTYANIAVEIFRQMQWTYFSVLYENGVAFEPMAKLFESTLTADRGTCLAKSVPLRTDAPLEEVKTAIRQLMTAEESKAVVMFLGDRNTLQILKAVVSENVPAGRFVFVTKFNDDWTQDADFLIPLERFGQGLVTVELQRRNATDFAKFLSNLTMSNYSPFPTAWFEDFWQQNFQCVLQEASSPSEQFSTVCTGDERLSMDNFIQGASVLPTILAVHTAARGLHRFLMQNCPSQTAVDSLDACVAASPYKVSKMDTRTELINAFQAVNFSYIYGQQKEEVQANFGTSRFLDAEYFVRNLIREADGNFQAQEVGLWKKETGLLLDINQLVVYDGRGERKSPISKCTNSTCASMCADRLISTAQNYSTAPEMNLAGVAGPSASLYFNSVWGIVVAAVAGLGMLTCVICIIYFSVTFPVSHGTTILGYMILFGLIVLYALAFAYVVAPTPFSCSVRRFCTGVAWAFVFAPMLIKVFYAWHARRSIMKPPARLDNPISPCSLFCLAILTVGVQIVIASEWLILQTPDGIVYLTSFHGEPLSSSSTGVWRCSPGDTFETVIIISTVYVMFLLFLTTLFSIITWNVDEHNRESRWIFLACAMSIVVWLVWTLLATRLEYKLRDPTIAIGIVVNATIILLCLYLRKAYLYSKYRREAKEVLFDNQSAVYLTSTLASGGHIMLDSNMFYDGKMIQSTNGNICVLSSPTTLQAPVPPSRRHCLPVASPPTPSGVGLTSRRTSEGKSILYSNSAFEGSCEFNPGGRSEALNGSMLLHNGRSNGSFASSTPTNHRF